MADDSIVPAIRDRVVGLRRVRAGDLIKNKHNYRKHTSYQRGVLRGLLEEVGYVAALIARETPDGLELVDGEMRSEETPDMEVPVLIVDLSDDEVQKVLLTFDPIASMAVADENTQKALLSVFDTQNADLRRFVTDIEEQFAEPDVGIDDEDDQKARDKDVPGMELQPHEHYDYLVVLCRTTHEWNVLCDKLELVPGKRRGTMGTCRAIRAERFFTLLADRAQQKLEADDADAG